MKAIPYFSWSAIKAKGHFHPILLNFSSWNLYLFSCSRNHHQISTFQLKKKADELSSHYAKSLNLDLQSPSHFHLWGILLLVPSCFYRYSSTHPDWDSGQLIFLEVINKYFLCNSISLLESQRQEVKVSKQVPLKRM